MSSVRVYIPKLDQLGHLALEPIDELVPGIDYTVLSTPEEEESWFEVILDGGQKCLCRTRELVYLPQMSE